MDLFFSTYYAVPGIKGTRFPHVRITLNLELGKGSKFQTRNQGIICTKKALHACLTFYSTSLQAKTYVQATDQTRI